MFNVWGFVSIIDVWILIILPREDAFCCSQGKEVTLGSKAAYLADSNICHKRLFSEFLASVNIRKMYFNSRFTHCQKGVPYCNGCMGISGRVYNEGIIVTFLNSFYYLTLIVNLQYPDLDT